jgi:hypothetical protein
MVGWRILFETGAKDRFASYVTGWCGQSRSRRMKARKYGRTGGRTERAGGVCPFEKHSPLGEAFKIRSFVKSRMAIESGVRPAQVVRHNENDVGFCGKGCPKRQKKGQAMKREVLRA